MSKMDQYNGRFLREEDIPRVKEMPKEENFSYFCKYDELSGVVACPGIKLPSFDNSCYVSRRYFERELKKESAREKKQR